MVPLGERFSVLDLIVNMGCSAVAVLHNQLGMLNDTTLTLGAL